MDNLVNTSEIALFIILPLIILYKILNQTYKVYVFNIFFIYFIWYLSYSLLHELSHMIGVWIIRVEVVDYQFIPHFWEGDFKTGYIEINYDNNFQELFVAIIAYFRDIIFLFTGYILLKRKKIKNAFFIGLIFTLFILSPLYDIINNYLAYLFGSLNDFNTIKTSTNTFTTHLIGILFSMSALTATIKIFRFYKKSPDIKY